MACACLSVRQGQARHVAAALCRRRQHVEAQGLVVDGRVVALAAGRVAEVGEDELRGKWLDLAFESGWHATYWHLDRTMHGIVKDKEVARGDMVGLVGRSGKASGPRLRLELRDPEGKAIYPEMAQATAKLREQTGEQLSESDLEAFKRDVATWRKLLKNAGRSGS